jgi:ketosteroid isomerase-like protein
MSEHPNSATVRSVYGAVNRKDIAGLTGLLSPDVTLLVPGRSPLAGRYEGRDAVFGFFGKLGAISGGTHRDELRDVYANDDQVVAVHHGTGTRDDKTLDVDVALLFEVESGVVTALTVHQRRQDDWDDFFS